MRSLRPRFHKQLKRRQMWKRSNPGSSARVFSCPAANAAGLFFFSICHSYGLRNSPCELRGVALGSSQPAVSNQMFAQHSMNTKSTTPLRGFKFSSTTPPSLLKHANKFLGRHPMWEAFPICSFVEEAHILFAVWAAAPTRPGGREPF